MIISKWQGRSSDATLYPLGRRLEFASYGVINMGARSKRITLNLDSDMERRLVTTAALKGVSVPQYCHAAIGRELASDEVQGVAQLPFGHDAIDRLEVLRRAATDDRKLPGDSAEFIRGSPDGEVSGLNGFAVVDASLAVKWLVEEDNSDRAHALARTWADEGTTPAAPYLLPVRGGQRSTQAGGAGRVHRRDGGAPARDAPGFGNRAARNTVDPCQSPQAGRCVETGCSLRRTLSGPG